MLRCLVSKSSLFSHWQRYNILSKVLKMNFHFDFKAKVSHQSPFKYFFYLCPKLIKNIEKMKKLFLFVAVTTLGLMTSCSSDDNKGGNGSGSAELKVTIDGVAKTFNTIVVNEESYTDGGETYVELEITATINNDPSEMIVFSLDEGDLGASAIWTFYYIKNGESYYHYNLSSVVQTNSNKKLKGTFSGSVAKWSNEDQQNIYVQLTNGSFDISY